MMLRVGGANTGHQRREGIALIIVLLTLFTLGVMAGIFAHAMKVETRLAINTTSGSEMEWMGRSGVEIAKWILVQQETRVPSERGYFALNQFWAGGPGPVDSVDNPFSGMTLDQIPLGDGTISIAITDQERWVNINSIYRNPLMLDQALSMAGADATDASLVGAALVDWIDSNDVPQATGGAESDFYLERQPPYEAKNGPVDDVAELRLVRGISREMFLGPGWRQTTLGQDVLESGGSVSGSGREPGAEGAGMSQIFCAISTGRVNINTAPFAVLRLILNGDDSRAHEAIRIRDELPAHDVGDIARVLGGAPAAGGGIQLSTQSYTFSIRVTARLGAARASYVGLISRSGSRDYQVLSFRRE